MPIRIHDRFTGIINTLPNRLMPMASGYSLVSYFLPIQQGASNLCVTFEDAEDQCFADHLMQVKLGKVQNEPWVIAGYVTYDPPVINGGAHDSSGWVIPIRLTARGREALIAMTGNYVWDCLTHAIDLDATGAYYQDHLINGRLSTSMAEAMIAFTEPCLQSLISDLIMFLMASERSGEFWIRSDPVLSSL